MNEAMNDAAVVTRDKLFKDFKVIVADAEELLRATASQAGEKVSAARERFEGSLRQAKVKLAEAEDMIMNKAKQTAAATDQYVQENPWSAIGVAAGVGFVIGLLVGRR